VTDLCPPSVMRADGGNGESVIPIGHAIGPAKPGPPHGFLLKGADPIDGSLMFA
jgi:hypothetical protein